MVEESLPFRITLDENVLIASACKHASYTGGATTTSTRQMDFKEGELPKWGGLMSVTMAFRDEEGNTLPASFQFLVWLSDESSDFSVFPGAQ